MVTSSPWSARRSSTEVGGATGRPSAHSCAHTVKALRVASRCPSATLDGTLPASDRQLRGDGFDVSWPEKRLRSRQPRTFCRFRPATTAFTATGTATPPTRRYRTQPVRALATPARPSRTSVLFHIWRRRPRQCPHRAAHVLGNHPECTLYLTQFHLARGRIVEPLDEVAQDG
jgi:hypothetical protein